MKACKHCESVLHSSFQCFSNRKPLKTKRYMKKIGKVTKQWISTRKEWIAKNLPDSGVWHCAYCGCELRLNTLTLDHKLSRGRHPELRYELSNLVPACYSCNRLKGSKDYDEFI